MDLQPSVVSAVVAQKEEFADIFTKKLVTASLRNIIDKSTPYERDERATVVDPKFKAGLDAIASNISTNVVDAYKKSGIVPSGNFFDSMVNCISTHVSMEADSRMEEIFNDIKLGKLDTSRLDWVKNSAESFSGFKFTNHDVAKHFNSEFNSILSVEEAGVIQDIKNDVKDSIAEAETKSQIVEDTVNEVNDIKKELDPPDDNPDTAPVNGSGDAGTATPPPAADDSAASTDAPAEDSPKYDADGNEIPATDDAGAAEDTPAEEPVNDDDTSANTTEDDSTANADTDDESGEDIIGGDTEKEEGDNTDTVTGDGGDGDASATTTDDSSASTDATPPAKEESDDTPTKDSKAVTAEATAEAFIPILPRKLKSSKQYSVEAMACDFFRASGNASKEVRIRLDSLKLALTAENLTQNNEYLEKYNDIEEKTSEALRLASEIGKSLESMGLTQNGLYKKDQIAVECARNIIGRFVNKKMTVSPSQKDFTSTENVLTNAFDIVQLKQNIKSGVYGKDKKLFTRELDSRESAFYKNLINVQDKGVIDAANNVMRLQDVKLDRVITPDFIKDYKMTVWESNIGNIKNVNEEVFNRVSAKYEALWGRKLTADEADIIRATTNNEDATEIVPTEFEKFVIKFGKEEMATSRESGNTISFTDAIRKKVFLKAKVYTSVYKTLEHLDILNKNDVNEFGRFINAI